MKQQHGHLLPLPLSVATTLLLALPFCAPGPGQHFEGMEIPCDLITILPTLRVSLALWLPGALAHSWPMTLAWGKDWGSKEV